MGTPLCCRCRLEQKNARSATDVRPSPRPTVSPTASATIFLFEGALDTIEFVGEDEETGELVVVGRRVGSAIEGGRV